MFGVKPSCDMEDFMTLRWKRYIKSWNLKQKIIHVTIVDINHSKSCTFNSISKPFMKYQRPYVCKVWLQKRKLKWPYKACTLEVLSAAVTLINVGLFSEKNVTLKKEIYNYQRIDYPGNFHVIQLR